MAAKTSWHRYVTKLRHGHPVYACVCVRVAVMNGYAGSYSGLSPIHNGPSAAAAAAGTLIPLGATFPAVHLSYTYTYFLKQEGQNNFHSI